MTFIPFAGPYMTRRRRADQPGLLQLRAIVIDLSIALPLFIIAFSFIDPWNARELGAAPYVVVGIGLVSIAWARQVSRRRIHGRSERELAMSYRSHMFIGIGIAEGAALWAIVVTFFVSPSLWLIVLGSVFSLIAFWFVAPTQRNLALHQQRLHEEGSSFDLMTGLNDLPSTGRRRSASE